MTDFSEKHFWWMFAGFDVFRRFTRAYIYVHYVHFASFRFHCHLLWHFPVLHFPVRHFPVRQIPVLHFPVLQIQRPRV